MDRPVLVSLAKLSLECSKGYSAEQNGGLGALLGSPVTLLRILFVSDEIGDL